MTNRNDAEGMEMPVYIVIKGARYAGVYRGEDFAFVRNGVTEYVTASQLIERGWGWVA